MVHIAQKACWLKFISTAAKIHYVDGGTPSMVP